MKKKKCLTTYRCRKINERSVRPDLTSVESFDARVFGYWNGLSDSTNNLSMGIKLSSNNLRTEFSDLSYNHLV